MENTPLDADTPFRREITAEELATRVAASESRPAEPLADRVSAGVGEAAGGISGVLAGAALGSLGGPIGSIIGAIAGAVSGWWAGHTIADTARQYEALHDAHFRQQYAGPAEYDEVRPAFQLGYLAGANPDWNDHTFEDVEPTLREGWHNVRERHGEWGAVRDYARDAFIRARTTEPL